ncbi:MAG: DUF1146 family protein [Mycoplasmatota bacterium]|nr:DUF1146 family protein [Mycoplasmatota bacterium]
MYNFLLYLLVLIIVIWAMDGVNINAIFKKNRVYQAKVFYIIIIFSLASMTTNFILSFLNSLK